MKTNWYAILFMSCFISSAFAAEPEALPEVDSLNTANQQYDRDSSFGQDQNGLLQWFKKVDALQGEVQELRGRVEELDYQLTLAKSSSEKEISSLKAQIAKLTGSPNPPKLQESNATPFNKTSTSLGIKPSDFTQAKSESQQYDEAYQLLQARKYDKARQGFEALLQQAPQSQYAPNAYYWLGEIYLIEDQWQQASNAFQMVIQQYPAHQKAADALLKLGIVSYQQGQWGNARQYLQEVKSKYPNTVSARLAANRLLKMDNEGV